MPFYMQYEGIDGSVRNADAFDFSQLTTEPTEAGAVAGIVIAATSDNNRVAIDDGADVLTTEPTEAGAVAGIVIAATSDNNRVAIDDRADVLTTEPTEAGAVAGIVIAATSDNNRVAIDDGADVLTGGTFDFVPQLTTETGLTTTATLTGVISSFGKEGMRPPPVVPSARMVACLGIS